MRKKRKIILMFGLVLAIIFAIKAILFFITRPILIDLHDFYAQYDILTQPLNYDPNENAEPEYQKSFEMFTRMPGHLITPYVTWPSDFNEADMRSFEEWLNVNKESLDFFRYATKKPYSWLEIHPLINRPLEEKPDPTGSMLRLIEAVQWNAKSAASNGRTELAFEDVLVCWRAAQHRCRTPSFISEQSFGLSDKQTTLATIFEILGRVKINSEDLRSLQNSLEKEFLEDRYQPYFGAKKLWAYDELQKTFVDNGKGTGRLSLRKAKYFLCSCTEYKLNPYLACFIGPTKNEMADRIDEIFASLEPIKTESPWQLHNRDPNFFSRLDKTCSDDFFLSGNNPQPKNIFRLYHLTKATEQALLTTITVLRFEVDNNRLPDSLDELLSAGYLKSIPLDPYSNGPLVYKQTEDDFILYSVGEDFEDNGGQAIASFGFMIYRYGHSVEHRDILFWPVKGFERREK